MATQRQRTTLKTSTGIRSSPTPILKKCYCTRPAEIGCRYETICEGCSFFATTISFRDQIQAQHDDAHRHGDHDRKKIYTNLLDRLDKTGT